ncbi:ferritin-like domain-containing protein [Pantoea sp. C2G6]|uniref:ferritin-like domain-containing protein n=1 Tax=Pantoea sp. C2G6 TaxID=3243084 RepID=UPI003ED88379
MTAIENYHDWLRDAHAMEKQAESMLSKMSGRLEHYPALEQRLAQHLDETKHQLTLLEQLLDSHGIDHSVMKDVMGKMAATGQAVGGMFNSDEVVKGAISGYVFENAEIASYTSLIAAAEQVGDTQGVRILSEIRDQEVAMAEWLLQHLPEVTQQFLQRSAQPGTEAKK